MTTIAWDGKTLAADRQANVGSLKREVTKIRRLYDKKADHFVLVGLSGDLMWLGSLCAWVENGRDPAEFPAHQKDKDDWQPFLVIENDGSVSHYERSPYPIRPESRYFAMGSGRDFATAAMFCGKTAAEAVGVAMHLDAATGQGINTLTHASAEKAFPVNDQEAHHNPTVRLAAG